MSKSKSEKSLLFPIVFFLDTNILDELPDTLSSGELDNFLTAAWELSVDVYLPDVVAREWCWHRIEKAQTEWHKANKACKHIGKYCEGKVNVEGNFDEIAKKVQEVSAKLLKESGFRISMPPDVSIRAMTRRAVEKAPPFQSANRGFKDELIVQSMLTQAKKQDYNTVVLITKDSGLNSRELQGIFNETDAVLLIVRSLSQGKELLDKGLAQAWLDLEKKRTERIAGLVKPYWEDISTSVSRAVRERGLTDFTLMIRRRGKEGAVKRLVDIRPRRIGKAVSGAENRADGRILITLDIECEVDVEIELSDYLTQLARRRIGFEERGIEVTFPLFGGSRRIETIRVSVRVEASAVKTEKDDFEDFRLEEVKV